MVQYLFLRAIDGTRTRGLRLGKATYYQLYHYRINKKYFIKLTIAVISTAMVILHGYSEKVKYLFIELTTVFAFATL